MSKQDLLINVFQLVQSFRDFNNLNQKIMPQFSYKAVDSRGQQTEGIIEAANQADATQRIKAMGLFPTTVIAGVPDPVASPAKPKLKKGGAGAVPSKTPLGVHPP